MKVAKRQHDMRFDIPCVGAGTVETCAKAGVAVLAFEGQRTLLLERENVEALLARHKMAILAVCGDALSGERLREAVTPFGRR